MEEGKYDKVYISVAQEGNKETKMKDAILNEHNVFLEAKQPLLRWDVSEEDPNPLVARQQKTSSFSAARMNTKFDKFSVSGKRQF